MSDLELHPASVLEAITDVQPDALALWSDVGHRTWAELDERAARFSAALEAGGVRRFASVGLMMRNSNEYLEAHHGIYKSRCVPVNVNYRYQGEELAYLLDDCECEVLLFDRSFAPLITEMRDRLAGLRLLICVEDGQPAEDGGESMEFEALLAAHDPAPRRPRSEDDPYLFYTGGTTGMPKGMAMKVGARLTEGAVRLAVETLRLPPSIKAYGPGAASLLAERGERPRSLSAAPLMHSTAINASAIPTLMFGGTVVTCRTRSFSPRITLEAAAAAEATSITIGGDAMAKPLLFELEADLERKEPLKLDSLKVIVSSGMAWSQEVKRGLMANLPAVEIFELYGTTEGLMGTLHASHPDELSVVPSFTPAEGVKLIDDRGREVDRGERGLVAFPVPDSEHYHRDQAKSEETFRWIDGVHYAVPGDWGVIEPDGRLRPIGRGAKVVNTGGEKVFTEEVEAIIREVPGVIDCLVLGVPSERWGEEVTALVASVPSAGLTGQQVMDQVRERLADYKVPKSVLFTGEIPRHANSKADFEAARALLDELLAARWQD